MGVPSIICVRVFPLFIKHFLRLSKCVSTYRRVSNFPDNHIK